MTNPAIKSLIDVYLETINEIAELDEKLGNVQSSGRVAFNALVTAHPQFVAEAQSWLQSFLFLDDEVQQLVWASVLQTNSKKVTELIGSYIKANTPEVTESDVNADERTVLATARSETQKLAKSLRGTLDIMLKGEDEILATLPDCPEGIRGAIGPRGAMGRRIDNNFSYTINGEDLGVMLPAEAAKAAKIKPSALRRMVTEKYPDGTPDNWSIQLGMTVVQAVRDISVPVEDTDEDEEEAEDTSDF